MLSRRLILTFAACALAAGCATAPRTTTVVAPAGSPFGELEPLYAAEAGRGALTIRVSSNGCTQKADFAHFVERKGAGVALAFGRRRLDPCRSFAMGQASLVFTYEELGVEPGAAIFLLNPMIPWTGPGG
jgi:hypothetical protein